MAITCTLLISSCSGGGSSNRSSDDRSVVSTNTSSGGIIKRADGSIIKTGGYKSANPAARASAPKYKAKSTKDLPSKVDLRKFMTAVENQGELGSCTANATAGAYEYLINRNQGISDYNVSRLFLYYNARAIDNNTSRDEGTFNSSILQSLNETGVCSEDTWPYVVKKFAQKPSSESYSEAQENRISKYEFVPLELDTWKSVLAEGYPIIFAVNTYSSFENPRKGFIPMPRSGERDEGGHAMCCVGYSDPDECFIVRNSWGHQWGDGGYCYIPYEYMMDPSLNCDDSWVIYDVNPISSQAAKEAWSYDDESIFVDMEDEFSEMSDEDWEDMCDELGEYDIVYRLGALYNVAYWGDIEVSSEEKKLAQDKLKRILQMFELEYSPKKVLKNCENLWIDKDNFLEDTVEILSKYISEGALATIAADMFEIAEADDDLADDERLLIAGLVGDWLNEDLVEEYFSDWLEDYDEDDDYYDYYDDEDWDDYYYDDDYYDDDDYYYDDDDDYYDDDDDYYDDDDDYYDDDDDYYDDDDDYYDDDDDYYDDDDNYYDDDDDYDDYSNGQDQYQYQYQYQSQDQSQSQYQYQYQSQSSASASASAGGASASASASASAGGASASASASAR